jgi:topoisomerase-4 subunit A
LDFADFLIKGRDAKGNLVTKHFVKKIELKEKGVSTLKPRKIWFDDTVMRLNADARGELLGEFSGDDRLLIVNQKGIVRTVIPDLNLHFDDDMIVLEKWMPNKPISVIYFEGEKERYFVKRFLIENENKEELIITEHAKSRLEIVSTEHRPVMEIVFDKAKGKDPKPNQTIDVENFIAVKGIKAQGNQLTTDKIKVINHLEPLPYEEKEEIVSADDIEVVTEENEQTENKMLNIENKKKNLDSFDQQQMELEL